MASPDPNKHRRTQKAVILTALGLEFRAVCEFFVDSVEEVGDAGAVYQCGVFGKDSTAWSVLVAETGTGNVEAALHAEAAITHFEPDVLLFVGVAGGLKDVKLGDVVASTKVYGYESGKQEAEFLPRPMIALPTFALEQRARAAVRDRAWISRLTDSDTRVDAHVGAIAAGEKVLVSRRSDLYKFLKRTYGDALAVDMEGYGCLVATRRHPQVDALVIRGISDLIHGKTRADATGSQEKAARHASAFAFEVLAGLAGAGSQQTRSRASSSEVSPSVKVSTGHLPVTGKYLFGREAMLKLLDGAWDDEKTNVFALVAGGGVGKSALVNHWLAAMGQDDYRGARRVYGHSFYSQGTSDGTASADSFFATALAWFDDPDPKKGSAWARGERLAKLVRQERTLLILDGMEPLQRPPGPNAGRVTDPGLQALLRQLAARNPGLCVVTTRERVADLDNFDAQGARQAAMKVLPVAVGARLLKKLGVNGSLKDRKAASKAFGNHALALTLLGKYLGTACDGDVRRHTEVSLLDADTMHGGHARKVMASYEKWFTEHRRGAELAIVRMLGLFNRPAEAGCIAALRGGKPIADLTAGLAGISEADWNIALANLREAGLLAKEDEESRGTLDAHPLVREHFAERLEKHYPEAWKAGHERLYKYLKGPGCKMDLPNTAEEMAPLYAAVLHGCAAGRYQEVLDEVHRRRIQRGKEFYNTKKLGAFSADLGALAGLFEEPWRRPVAALSEADQAFVLNQAGFRLRALGRLTEAVESMRGGLEWAKDRERWVNAAQAAGTISEVYLTLGRMREAIDAAKQSNDFADRSDDAFTRMGTRTILADAFHQGERVSEAEALFQEAERMQTEMQPEYPLLYAVQGYRYCGLLLDRGDHPGVIEQATQTLQWAKQGRQGSLLAIALHNLSLGRAHLLAAQAEGTDAYKKARAHIDLAVDGLRDAGTLHHLPRGLLARAELYLFTGDHAEARAALNEAMDIATRDPAGHMKLHVTDCHLGYARLAAAEKKPDDARRELAKARALIKETGYHRRDAELAELEKRGRESFSR